MLALIVTYVREQVYVRDSKVKRCRRKRQNRKCSGEVLIDEYMIQREKTNNATTSTERTLTTTDTIQLPQSGCWLSRTDANERKICVSPETRTRRGREGAAGVGAAPARREPNAKLFASRTVNEINT
ncbi:hypothetical protein EVAR_99160_1 [Eumeta japonica]|uniref:Uncharacterized protein n=1 Tax=Eumeta variegata TaxID=151549 RepID=A0A4C1YBX2_EUMVA|nr:hypothetical protein EVAR_99160_1 [Eumeta japonica]